MRGGEEGGISKAVAIGTLYLRNHRCVSLLRVLARRGLGADERHVQARTLGYGVSVRRAGAGSTRREDEPSRPASPIRLPVEVRPLQ
jgi:hypothetical protein